MDNKFSLWGRRWTEWTGYAALAFALSSSATAYAETLGTRVSMGKAVYATPAKMSEMKHVSQLSPDNSVLSTLFDDFSASSEVGGSPVKIVLLEIPLKNAAADTTKSAPPLGIRFQLRGYGEVPKMAFASVVVIVGGESQAVTFPVGEPKEADFSKQMFFLFKGNQKKIPAETLRVQIVINVEKYGTENVYLSVDALDAQVH